MQSVAERKLSLIIEAMIQARLLLTQAIDKATDQRSSQPAAISFQPIKPHIYRHYGAWIAVKPWFPNLGIERRAVGDTPREAFLALKSLLAPPHS